MPFGTFINALPPVAFLAVHLVAFLAGSFFAFRSFDAGASKLGWGFVLYAVAELVYMTYHLDWTVFLFAHTIAEVLNLVGFSLIFLGVAQRLRSSGALGAARA
jgi:predicted phage tail protein